MKWTLPADSPLAFHFFQYGVFTGRAADPQMPQTPAAMGQAGNLPDLLRALLQGYQLLLNLTDVGCKAIDL